MKKTLLPLKSKNSIIPRRISETLLMKKLFRCKRNLIVIYSRSVKQKPIKKQLMSWRRSLQEMKEQSNLPKVGFIVKQ